MSPIVAAGRGRNTRDRRGNSRFSRSSGGALHSNGDLEPEEYISDFRELYSENFGF